MFSFLVSGPDRDYLKLQFPEQLQQQLQKSSSNSVRVPASLLPLTSDPADPGADSADVQLTAGQPGLTPAHTSHQSTQPRDPTTSLYWFISSVHIITILHCADAEINSRQFQSIEPGK